MINRGLSGTLACRKYSKQGLRCIVSCTAFLTDAFQLQYLVLNLKFMKIIGWFQNFYKYLFKLLILAGELYPSLAEIALYNINLVA